MTTKAPYKPAPAQAGGGPLSPLLANLLLDDLDKELERRGYRFVRGACPRAALSRLGKNSCADGYIVQFVAW